MHKSYRDSQASSTANCVTLGASAWYGQAERRVTVRKHAVLAIALLLLCAVQSGAQTSQVKGRTFTLTVTPGKDYGASTTILLFIRIPLYAQIACWLETPDGKYVDAIYVTPKGAKKSFFSAPARGRPEALPVWYHRQAGKPAVPDAVSGATASKEAAHAKRLAVGPGRYVVFLEVNRSYDYNERYTKANSGVNGQPSLIYRAELEAGKDPSRARFEPIGTGSVDGSDGTITPGLEGITTALTLIDHATIECSGE